MVEAFHLDLSAAALGQAVVILEEVAVILEEAAVILEAVVVILEVVAVILEVGAAILEVVEVILVLTGSKGLVEVISLADRAHLAAVGQTDLVVVAPTIAGPVLVAVA